MIALKREKYRETMIQIDKRNKFNENRRKQIEQNHEIKQVNDLQCKAIVGLEQLANLLRDQDDNLNQCVEQLLYVIQQCHRVDSNNLINSLNLITIYMFNNLNKQAYLNILNLMQALCDKNMVFCNNYCHSEHYENIQQHLHSLNIEFQIKLINFIHQIQLLEPHPINLQQISTCIKYWVSQYKQTKVLTVELQNIIIVCINLVIDFRNDSDLQVLITQINCYYLVVILNESGGFLISNELILYLDYLQTQLKYSNESTIELINQIAFNPKFINYQEECAIAIGIIGILLSGKSKQFIHYYQKFSNNQQLEHQLLNTFTFGDSQVRRLSLFTLSNIFGEESINLHYLYQSMFIDEFIRRVKLEVQCDVYCEVLQCLNNLIINSDKQQFISLLVKYELVELIIQFDQQQMESLIVQNLLGIIVKSNELPTRDIHTELQTRSIIDYLWHKGVHFIVKSIFENSREVDDNLKTLMSNLFEEEQFD